MKNLTLRQLRYFDALVRHRHFGRAAEVCSISQPALSVQIRELEAELGGKLVERGARYVRLTGLGEAVALRAQGLLQSVDDLGDLARAVSETPLARLRIGVIPTIGPYLLPGILKRLKTTYPGHDVHVRETLTSRLIDELNEGQIDAAILALPVSEASLTEAPLFNENLLLVRPEADRGQPVPSAADLRDMRLLLLEEGHCFRDQALSFCQFRPVGSRPGLDASSLSTLVQLVGADLGVTFIPEMAVEIETRKAPVCVCRFGDPQPQRTVGMVWRRSNPLADHLHALSEVIAEAADKARRVGVAAQ